MTRTITVSLPVADLATAKAFYAALGFVHDPACSSDGAAHMTWSDTISVMLLSHATWGTFTTRSICPRTASEVALNISCASRAEVDALNRVAAAHGGTPDINPVEEHGFMYGRDFADPDGHIWGAMWMEPPAAG